MDRLGCFEAFPAHCIVLRGLENHGAFEKVLWLWLGKWRRLWPFLVNYKEYVSEFQKKTTDRGNLASGKKLTELANFGGHSLGARAESKTMKVAKG